MRVFTCGLHSVTSELSIADTMMNLVWSLLYLIHYVSRFNGFIR